MDVFAEQAAEQRGLAGAVRADQGNAFAGRDLEIDRCRESAPIEVLGDTLQEIMSRPSRLGRRADRLRRPSAGVGDRALARVVSPSSRSHSAVSGARENPLMSNRNAPVGHTSMHMAQRITVRSIGVAVSRP